MLEVLLDHVFTYGVFAGLFMWLLYTTNHRNTCREKMYQRTIRDNQRIISEQAKAFGSLAGDVTDIKELLFRKSFD